MSENKMKEVAELLGVEIDKPFNIKEYEYNPCEITYDGIVNNHGTLVSDRLNQLLTGQLKIERQILNEKEKRYLEDVIRPFKSRVMFIAKTEEFGYEHIYIRVSLPIHAHGNTTCKFPYFDKGTMYKGMELYKKYNLEELRLFESDGEKDVD